MPSGGAGLYYFSTYLGVSVSEYALFDMVVNDEAVCSAEGDSNHAPLDRAQALCNAVLNVAEGY